VSPDVTIPWFLWSIVRPHGSTPANEIHATPIHEYKNQEECEKARAAYQIEVDKAYPYPPWPSDRKDGETRIVTWPTARLMCSPINPKP